MYINEIMELTKKDRKIAEGVEYICKKANVYPPDHVRERDGVVTIKGIPVSDEVLLTREGIGLIVSELEY